MKVTIYTDNIVKNIKKAETLVDVPVSLMFKDFYEDIWEHIHHRVDNSIFSLRYEDSVCYSIGKASYGQKGAVVATTLDAMNSVVDKCINHIYIPINAFDNREGLSLFESKQITKAVCKLNENVCVYGMITSGCLNANRPSINRLHEIWSKLNGHIESISIGGSFWLGQDKTLPEFITDVRIGEYMLFGTIPYYEGEEKLGLNGIELQTEVIGVYPERNQILLDCGYSMADMAECRCLDKNLVFSDSSSEYTIMSVCGDSSNYCIGDIVTFIPNYKSLVKLRYAEREFR